MLIKNARIIDPASSTDMVGDIKIEDGRIAAIGSNLKSDEEVIDASGKWVIPGLVDLHVHFRDPGLEYKEDIETGSKAAAAGGVTTVACMANTDPVNDNASVTKYIIDKAKAVSCINVLPVGAVTKGLKGQELSEMGLMKAAGIVAVSDDGQPVQDSGLLRSAMEYAATFGLKVFTHCQDRDLDGGGVMNESALSSELGLPGIPNAAEDVQIARDVTLAEYTGLPIHITHVATRGGMEIIRRAKHHGVKVTCEVAPHHLLLTEAAVGKYDTDAKMYPPLRSEDDRQALIEALREGIVDCIATDHAPHAKDEKDRAFEHAPCGIIGLQTLLPAILKLQRENDLDLMSLIGLMTSGPADLINIEAGRIQPGAPADLAIVDPDEEWVFTADMILSKSKNSPFIGEQFRGKVKQTIVAGKVVYKD